jgi:hypothetical protein
MRSAGVIGLSPSGGLPLRFFVTLFFVTLSDFVTGIFITETFVASAMGVVACALANLASRIRLSRRGRLRGGRGDVARCGHALAKREDHPAPSRAGGAGQQASEAGEITGPLPYLSASLASRSARNCARFALRSAP